MDIREEFNSIADKYDVNRRKFIPCFDEFYRGTTAFIAAVIPPPRRVLDLGAGTGLLSYYWMEQFPDAVYTLADVAGSMLDVARERFREKENVKYVASDYANDFSLEGYDTVISALSIHHLDDEGKRHLFTRIYNALPAGGVFVNYDQFCADNGKINDWVSSYWESKVVHSGLEKEDLSRWRERQKLDKECSVAREIEMLNGDGLLFNTAECVYMAGKFAVVLAVKA